MRSRDEILEAFDTVESQIYRDGDVAIVTENGTRLRLVIEVLLDIRDLLTPKGPKTVHPPSAPPPVLGKGRTG